ncbi:hypothetical protein LINPERPRIM_LOCUS10088 [Linum perenne]
MDYAASPLEPPPPHHLILFHPATVSSLSPHWPTKSSPISNPPPSGSTRVYPTGVSPNRGPIRILLPSRPPRRTLRWPPRRPQVP